MNTKAKTHRSTAKRFRVTAKGKVKYKKQGLRHILTKKASKRKRKLRRSGLLSPAERKRIRLLLPKG